MLALTALATAILTGIIGVSSASALFPTQLCTVHPEELECPPNKNTQEDIQRLEPGTYWKLLTSLINILCLFALKRASALDLGNPQPVHTTELNIGGCGTNAAHSNCTITAEELPLLTLLKTGLDEGVLTAQSGRLRVQCASLGIDCKYDLEGMELLMGAQHTTASEVPTTELGGKFFCPDEGRLDYLLVTLAPAPHYILS